MKETNRYGQIKLCSQEGSVCLVWKAIQVLPARPLFMLSISSIMNPTSLTVGEQQEQHAVPGQVSRS